jgi:hypothetical protein
LTRFVAIGYLLNLLYSPIVICLMQAANLLHVLPKRLTSRLSLARIYKEFSSNGTDDDPSSPYGLTYQSTPGTGDLQSVQHPKSRSSRTYSKPANETTQSMASQRIRERQNKLRLMIEQKQETLPKKKVVKPRKGIAPKTFGKGTG